MKTPLLKYVLLLISLASACSRGAFTQDGNPKPMVAGQRDEQNQALRNQLAQIASTTKGRIGISAVTLETGDSVSLNPHDHFPMQSVYKLPISMAVMNQVDAGKITLDQKMPVTKDDFIGPDAHSPIRDQNPNGAEMSVSELLRFAISESDGTASDVLMKLAVIESTPGANRLKGLLPVGTIVAHKTGTSGTEKGITAATNDIGIVTLSNGRHIAVAVFVADSPADENAREGVIAKIAKAIFEGMP